MDAEGALSLAFGALHPSWHTFFHENFQLPNEYYEAIKGKVIYPPEELIFNAFSRDINDIKVVLIGQDCYHGPNQAMGLSFSVPKGVPIPPSLGNLFTEMKNDLQLSPSQMPPNGDLTHWADQGVFLINAALSVEHKSPSSHLKYWEPFTDKVITYLSSTKPDLVYILLGSYAKKKKSLIKSAGVIIEATHPSPLGANQGGFFGSRIFSRTNDALTKMGKPPIKWTSSG